MIEYIFQFSTIDPLLVLGLSDSNLKLIQKKYAEAKITARGNDVKIVGNKEVVSELRIVFNNLLQLALKQGELNEEDIVPLLRNDQIDSTSLGVKKESDDEPLVHGPNGLIVRAKTKNQKILVESSTENDIVFAIGPAGSGKTYTAVALAVRALKNREVKKIILTRPAVEAGENLGFLPGDMKEKIDPYLRPLYDALGDMIQAEKLKGYLETGIIEIAPLAFMRGRTLDKAFVILDEAQNATQLQLKMFLTRMGPNAKFVITGDLTQIDLPRRSQSGLVQAIRILEGVEGMGFVYLSSEDVLRHKLVKRILKAYEKDDDNERNH